MPLFGKDTHWMFLLAGGDLGVEERHIADILAGVYVLHCRKINPNSITIVIDGKLPEKGSLSYSRLASHYAIKTIKDMESIALTNTYKNLVLFVTGHGDIDGITHTPPIKPRWLIDWIKHMEGLQQAVVYLGQCCAGIFRYMDVGAKQDDNKKKISPEIVVIGATDLFPSLSGPSQFIDQNKQPIFSWKANLFLFHLYEWLMNPHDVDGDGIYTVVDSYKYAGTKANARYISLKKEIFDLLTEHKEQWRKTEEKINQLEEESPNRQKLEWDRKAIRDSFMEKSSTHFNHQEPWILNSIPAQTMEF